MADSAFREALDFLGELGVFDVVLPFLLIFTMVFAILEKTKIFGVEKIGDHEYTKKNLNAMSALVIAFFAIASSRVVEVITEVSANMVIVLVGIIFFLLLAGSFHQEKKEAFFLEGRMRQVFMGISFVTLAFIFLNAVETDGKTWLEWIVDWLGDISGNQAVGSVVLLLIVVGVIFYITQGGSREEK